MRPNLFLLTGFPGTGKLTVARALERLLVEEGETARVVDNHWINNPIFGLIDQDGLNPLPDAVWDRVGEVAAAVTRTVEELTPQPWHMVFTAYLDGVTDIRTVTRLNEVAATRGSTFVPVRLLCEPEENARRIVSPERRQAIKSMDPDEPVRLAAAGPPYDPDHPDQLTLDITDLKPDRAAAAILEHALTLAAQNP